MSLLLSADYIHINEAYIFHASSNLENDMCEVGTVKNTVFQ